MWKYNSVVGLRTTRKVQKNQRLMKYELQEGMPAVPMEFGKTGTQKRAGIRRDY